ncbi:hypothetical protein [Paenibacillus odorifer]|nr:hypothetical protein [Paenibacillus odorifer]
MTGGPRTIDKISELPIKGSDNGVDRCFFSISEEVQEGEVSPNP